MKKTEIPRLIKQMAVYTATKTPRPLEQIESPSAFRETRIRQHHKVLSSRIMKLLNGTQDRYGRPSNLSV